MEVNVNMLDIFKVLFISSLRDKMTIFWSVLLPVILLIILGVINENPAYREQLLAAVVAMGILFNGLWGISFDVILNRNNGIFKVLRITPLKTFQFIFLSAFSKVIVSIMISYITLLVGILFFKIEFSVLGMVVLLPIFTIGVLGFMFLGFFVGNIAKKETQVSMIANIIGMPLLFLSNSFYHISENQKIVSFLLKINPFEYFINTVQETVGGDFQSLFQTTGILTALVIVSFTLAVLTFKWETTSEKRRKQPEKGMLV
jgi:ABC-2 type transport system permease protein